MASKHRTSFEMEIDVEFVDPEKAQGYFIDGTWKNVFYAAINLEDLVQNLATDFHNGYDKLSEDSKIWGRFVEGFGFFEKQKDNTYRRNETSSICGGGMIIIRYEQELEAFQTDELTEESG